MMALHVVRVNRLEGLFKYLLGRLRGTGGVWTEPLLS